MRRLTIGVVCGFGVISCTLMRLKLEEILKRRPDLTAEIRTTDLPQAATLECDLFVTPDAYSAALQERVRIPVLGVASVLNPIEFEREGVPFLCSLQCEGDWRQ